MDKLNLSEKIKNSLKEFIQKLKDLYQEDLVSVILYGSAASEEFVDRHSNLNLLVVLKSVDLIELNKAAKIIKKYTAIQALFLTEDYIASSTDIFPIEFLDMQENHFALYGKDFLRDIHIDTRNLRFQCEQELKAKLLNLRQLYLRIHKDSGALRNLLFKSFNSLLHILRNVLRLKGKKPAYLKQDILRGLAEEFQIDIKSWKRILAAKNKQLKLNNIDTEKLFFNFVRDIEKIVDTVDKL